MSEEIRAELRRRAAQSRLAREATAFLGLGTAAGGIAAVYWPAALIFTGLLLLALAIWAEARAGRQ